MGGLSIWHLVILAVVVVLVFGTSKLRNIGSDLGSAVRGFKDGLKDSDKPVDSAPAQQVTGQTIDAEVKEKTKT